MFVRLAMLRTSNQAIEHASKLIPHRCMYGCADPDSCYKEYENCKSFSNPLIAKAKRVKKGLLGLSLNICVILSA